MLKKVVAGCLIFTLLGGAAVLVRTYLASSATVPRDTLSSAMESQLSSQEEWLNKTLEDPSARTIQLRNSHFVNGSIVLDDNFIIYTDEDGETVREPIEAENVILQLEEDIEFNPNKSSADVAPHESGYVEPHQYEFYNPRAFGIGFFAAIVVQAEGVIIDLNDFELAQSEEHSLQQRFFANIELADQPFIPEQGPANFGDSIKSAKNVAITNGSIGRSSHHGIHGQLPENVLIKDVDFHNFEVAGVSLHGAKRTTITDSTIRDNNKEVPILGLWSALRFIQPYVEALPENYTLKANNEVVDKEQLQQTLATVNNDIVEGQEWSKKYPYLVNESGLTDGNVYGLVINQKGVAVNGFTDTFTAEKASEDVYVTSTSITDLSVSINEIPALAQSEKKDSGPQVDVVGAVLQTYGLSDESGQFNGSLETSPIQLAQAMVAQAILDDVDMGYLPVSKSTIASSTLDWIAGGTTFTDAGLRYILNGDSMHHVNKGLIAAKVDGSNKVVFDDVKIASIQNVSPSCLRFRELENYPKLTEDEKSYDSGDLVGLKGATAPGAGMNDVRGISLASTQNFHINDSHIEDLLSTSGPSFGVDAQFESDFITVDRLSTSNISPSSATPPADLSPSVPTKISTAYNYTLIEL